MECRHMVVTEEQNTADKCYGKFADRENFKTITLNIWTEFHELPDKKLFSWSEVNDIFYYNQDRFISFKPNKTFE